MNSPSNRGSQKLSRTNSILVLEKVQPERSKSLENLSPAKAERANMDAEYKFQHSNGDRFWGIDKERHRMLQDLGNMTREDSLSHDQEKYYKAMEVRQKWDRGASQYT